MKTVHFLICFVAVFTHLNFSFFLCNSFAGDVLPTPTKHVMKDVVWDTNLLETLTPSPFGDGFTKEENVFICENENSQEIRGVAYSVELNQKIPVPILASASSYAENVGGSTNPDYSIYLDIIYNDDTVEWGKAVPFDVGSHKWQKKEVLFFPEKPIKSLNMYTLFRQHKGKVGFRNIKLQAIYDAPHFVLFDGVPVIPAKTKRLPKNFQIRDLGFNSDINSDFYAFEDSSSDSAMPLKFSIQTKKISPEITEVTLKSLSNLTGPVTFLYAISIPEEQQTGLKFCTDLRKSETVTPPREYTNSRSYRIGSSGRLSRYPIAAVSNGALGVAIGIDLSTPAFFRTAYNSSTGELYVACDLCFTLENTSITLRFCDYVFNGKDEFRGALAGYYKLFPDYFTSRAKNHGLWMPFDKISNVENWQDFGFAFKEGDNETKWDDANGIMTFRYTEPMTWWMPVPKTNTDTAGTDDEAERSVKSAYEVAMQLKKDGKPEAIAFARSGFFNEKREPVAQLLDTPWCNGAVWSVNDAPGIKQPNSFSTKWNKQIFDRLYGPNRDTSIGELDGEYIDSSEGYVTAELDCRADHFEAMKTPLTFSQETN
ncbi:MAG: hypothetical protein ACRC2T_11500, partial [Thermoguttaceae bacterium]